MFKKEFMRLCWKMVVATFYTKVATKVATKWTRLQPERLQPFERIF
jgi:hypothetical protein